MKLLDSFRNSFAIPSGPGALLFGRERIFVDISFSENGWFRKWSVLVVKCKVEGKCSGELWGVLMHNRFEKWSVHCWHVIWVGNCGEDLQYLRVFQNILGLMLAATSLSFCLFWYCNLFCLNVHLKIVRNCLKIFKSVLWSLWALCALYFPCFKFSSPWSHQGGCDLVCEENEPLYIVFVWSAAFWKRVIKDCCYWWDHSTGSNDYQTVTWSLWWMHCFHPCTTCILSICPVYHLVYYYDYCLR